MDVNKLAKIYIKMRDAKALVKAEYDAKIAEIEQQMETVEQELLAACNELGANSINTDYGTIIKQTKSKYWTADWSAFHRFIVHNNKPELLERRVAQSAMAEYLATEPVDAAFPPGLQCDSVNTVVVRRKQSK